MALASAAMLFAACSQEDLLSPQEQLAQSPENNAIQFGTYMGKTGVTRAGYEGSIASAAGLQSVTDGFGVFAYYTGTKTYNQAQYYNSAAVADGDKLVPNFMYNQRVYWDDTNYPSGSGYITSWTYSPLKYWPNEIETGANHAADDQNNNSANDPAISAPHGSGDYYGGNVSFFAYAPYTYVTPSTGTPKTTDDASSSWGNYNGGTTDGITALTSNASKGDPKVTYVVASDGNVVDLLWGTWMGPRENAVKEGNNTGAVGDNDASNDLTGDTYENRILGNYRTNADQTKEKTTGTIGFLFKHALAKIGGSTTYGTGDYSKYGFLVVLDLDDMKGAETGGFYTNNGLSGGSQTTKVTINEITIDAFSLANTAPAGSPAVWKYLKKNQGDFNLATGQWDILTATNTQNANGYETATTDDDAARITHNILPTTTDIADTRNATLATSIAEAMEGAIHKDWDDQPTGVTTVAQNVYAAETNPMVFIPGTQTELYVTCDYYVRTKDANLQKGYSEVRQKIRKKITFTTPLELNKQYSLLMHIGLTGVKFTASVANWDLNTTDPNYDVDGVGGDDIHVEDVYVPINVSELLAFTPTLNTKADGSGSSHNPSTAFESEGGDFYLTNVAVNYSDNSDDDNISFADFGTEKVDITITGGASYESATGKITIPANTTESAQSYTITLKRGDLTTGNYQSETYTLNQKAPNFNSLVSVTLSKTSVNATTSDITPTVKAQYAHTGSASTFDIDVTSGGVHGSPTYTTSTDGSSYSSATSPFTATVSGTPSSGDKLLYVKATYNSVESATAAEVTYTTTP